MYRGVQKYSRYFHVSVILDDAPLIFDAQSTIYHFTLRTLYLGLGPKESTSY